MISDAEAMRRTVGALASANRTAGGTKAAVLLDELSARYGEVPLSDVPGAVVNLIDAYDLFGNPADERETDMLGAPAVWKLWWAVNPLLQRLGSLPRQETLRQAFADSRSLYALGAIHAALKSQYENRGIPGEEGDERCLAPASVVTELGETLRARIREAARDGSLIGQAGLMQILRTWFQLAGSEEVKAWTSEQLSEGTRVLILAKAATYTARVHVAGDRVSSEVPQVSLKALGELVDVDRLAARLTAMVAAGDEAAVTIAARFTQGAGRPS